MIGTAQLRYAAQSAGLNASTSHGTAPKVGEEIFAGTSYPRHWNDYIGQDSAKIQLAVACHSARVRKTRVDHVLIATGAHGVGKTALARLIAADLDVGFVEVQGVLSAEEGLKILRGMCDNDILFWDEFHLAVNGGKAKAEWLLSVLQDGVMVTKNGTVRIPNITIVAATTDVQKLPETIISRFQIRPVIEAYTVEEAAQIAAGKSVSIFDLPGLVQPSQATCVAVANAANCNPREIGNLLTTLRDAALSGYSKYDDEGTYDMDKALEWAGLTADGLDRLAQDYLTVVLVMFEGKAGEKTVANALGEPTSPRHTEKLLTQKGYLTTTASGRQLTEAGVTRTLDLLRTRGLLEN